MRVVVLEREQPLAVRRRVAFAEAVFDGAARVEGVLGGGWTPTRLAGGAACVAVVDRPGGRLAAGGADVLVDGRMSKRAAHAPVRRRARDRPRPRVHRRPRRDAVIETQRGPDLGPRHLGRRRGAGHRLPAPVLGHTEARVLRAPPGRFAAAGTSAPRGRRRHGRPGRRQPVTAGIGGLVRGLLRRGVTIARGAKVGDVDPRGASVDPYRMSDKARAVAAGALEAMLTWARV